MSENQLNKAAQEQEAPEQDINILKKDRIDKLAALRESGTDPFQVTKYDVTGHAADYKKQYEADEAKLPRRRRRRGKTRRGTCCTQRKNCPHRRQDHELARYG